MLPSDATGRGRLRSVVQQELHTAMGVTGGETRCVRDDGA